MFLSELQSINLHQGHDVEIATYCWEVQLLEVPWTACLHIGPIKADSCCRPFAPTKLLRQTHKRIYSDAQSRMLHILLSTVLLTPFRITRITYMCPTAGAASCSFGFQRLMSTTSPHPRPFNNLQHRLCNPLSSESMFYTKAS
jgi:hypothetical protein